MLKHLFFLFLLIPFIGYSQDNIIGNYKQIDDETGKVRSIINLRIENGKLYGKITKIYPEEGEPADPICTECTGKHKDQKIIGMDIIMGIDKDGDEWVLDDGILDPKTGTIYDVKIWQEGKSLKVRGYLGFFYRTQTWHKI